MRGAGRVGWTVTPFRRRQRGSTKNSTYTRFTKTRKTAPLSDNTLSTTTTTTHAVFIDESFIDKTMLLRGNGLGDFGASTHFVIH